MHTYTQTIFHHVARALNGGCRYIYIYSVRIKFIGTNTSHFNTAASTNGVELLGHHTMEKQRLCTSCNVNELLQF